MSSYSILITEKVKEMRVAEAYEYIDAIQSFKGDWPLYVTPKELLESEKEYDVESLTPIPATHGALEFLEFYVDEEELAEVLRGLIEEDYISPIMKALEAGVPLHRALPPSILEEFEDFGKLIKNYLIEIALPLREGGDVASMVEGFEWVEEVELFETEVFLVDPDLVEKELEKSYYVGEYLRRLEKLFSSAMETRLHLMLVRGFGEASLTFKDIEKAVEKLLKELPVVRCTTMFTRILPLA